MSVLLLSLFKSRPGQARLQQTKLTSPLHYNEAANPSSRAHIPLCSAFILNYHLQLSSVQQSRAELLMISEQDVDLAYISLNSSD